MISNSFETLTTQVEIQSTVSNSTQWKLWHVVNYLIGGITFFIGSIVYFPYFTSRIPSYDIAGWLYTIGSAGFLLADLTEWNHFRIHCLPCQENTSGYTCGQSLKRKELGFNFFTSATGSALYLIGSIFFIPALNMQQLGETYFIYGSAVIVISQVWKLQRTCCQGKSTFWNNIHEDLSGFMVDLFAGVGGAFYFIGTFVFHESETKTQKYNQAVWLFTLGGLNFFLSGIYVFKRYFLEKSSSYQHLQL